MQINSDSISTSCCEPSGVDIQSERLPRPRPGTPAGKPLARCLGSAAPCRLAQRRLKKGSQAERAGEINKKAEERRLCLFTKRMFGLSHVEELRDIQDLLRPVCQAPQGWRAAPPPLYRTEHPETAEIGGQDTEFFMRQERLDKIFPRSGDVHLQICLWSRMLPAEVGNDANGTDENGPNQQRAERCSTELKETAE
ncbi:hypothetical protein PAMP_015677 [Pampus punctatissimus]